MDGTLELRLVSPISPRGLRYGLASRPLRSLDRVIIGAGVGMVWEALLALGRGGISLVTVDNPSALLIVCAVRHAAERGGLMRFRRSPVLLFLIVLILLAGCGGGDQSGNGGQGDGSPGGTKKQGGEAAKKGVPATKIALGTVRRVNVEGEMRRLVLKPSANEQSKKAIPFRITKHATITLDDEKAELADIKEGQQAQISYIFKNEYNRAREV